MNLTEKQYQEHLEKIRKVSRDEGIDYILDKYEADVTLGRQIADYLPMPAEVVRNFLQLHLVMLLISFKAILLQACHLATWI
jgi:hypothetical protein